MFFDASAFSALIGPKDRDLDSVIFDLAGPSSTRYAAFEPLSSHVTSTFLSDHRNSFVRARTHILLMEVLRQLNFLPSR